MSKLYLPYASQFDLMNENLAKIAATLGSDTDISTWEGIQKAVRIGVAPSLIPAGTRLHVNHKVFGNVAYDVVAHDYFKSAHDKNAHTMTLLCHDIDTVMQFDAPEAFFYADSDLPAGIYNFTLATSYENWTVGTYSFDVPEGLPKGGQLCISGNSKEPLPSMSVQAYVNQKSTTIALSSEITEGNVGTSLGTFGVELNHSQRVSYGSNNYKESAIRQYLNSSLGEGSVWSPQTKFDRPPSWNTTHKGFLTYLDDDFLSVVGEVVVPCAANSIYESPDSTTAKGEKYNVTDKFYLASQREIFGTTSDTVADDSVLFPYYESATNADRVKYRDGTTTRWWLRSAQYQRSHYERVIYLDGSLYNYCANESLGVVPACTIV